MPAITVQIQNNNSTDYNVHVYDRFGNGRREVDGSPFALTENETSRGFGVNADNSGDGVIDWAADGGPSLSSVEVTNGQVVGMR